MIEEVSRNEMLSTIHYMTEHFPYRLAGSPCEAAASRYVTERLKQYGLEVENKEFYTYNSDPMYSKVTVLEPEMEIDSLPCAHIRATKPEGEIFELIYVGNGDYAAYKDIDVTGKMVLVEVSYAPPVPEKARIAYEMGAAGIMCMNWGNDEEVICRRGLKGVWGNPTEANFHCIPEIVGVGVTRGAGLKLKQLCLEGRKVEVSVFLDTFIICSMTGFVITMGAIWENPIYDWSTIKSSVIDVFAQSIAVLMPGTAFDEFSIIFGCMAYACFAFTTLLGGISFCEISTSKLSTSNRATNLVRIVSCFIMVPLGCLCVLANLELGNMWSVSDLINAIFILINVPTILIGSKIAFAALKDYVKTNGKPFTSDRIGVKTSVWTKEFAESYKD